jgi:hypothetical protein
MTQQILGFIRSPIVVDVILQESEMYVKMPYLDKHPAGKRVNS